MISKLIQDADSDNDSDNMPNGSSTTNNLSAISSSSSLNTKDNSPSQ